MAFSARYDLGLTKLRHQRRASGLPDGAFFARGKRQRRGKRFGSADLRKAADRGQITGHSTFSLVYIRGIHYNPLMPRTTRASVGGMFYHVLNRGNGRDEVFHKADDYAAFLQLLGEASIS